MINNFLFKCLLQKHYPFNLIYQNTLNIHVTVNFIILYFLTLKLALQPIEKKSLHTCTCTCLYFNCSTGYLLTLSLKKYKICTCTYNKNSYKWSQLVVVLLYIFLYLGNNIIYIEKVSLRDENFVIQQSD